MSEHGRSGFSFIRSLFEWKGEGERMTMRPLQNAEEISVLSVW